MLSFSTTDRRSVEAAEIQKSNSGREIETEI